MKEKFILLSRKTVLIKPKDHLKIIYQRKTELCIHFAHQILFFLWYMTLSVLRSTRNLKCRLKSWFHLGGGKAGEEKHFQIGFCHWINQYNFILQETFWQNRHSIKNKIFNDAFVFWMVVKRVIIDWCNRGAEKFPDRPVSQNLIKWLNIRIYF